MQPDAKSPPSVKPEPSPVDPMLARRLQTQAAAPPDKVELVPAKVVNQAKSPSSPSAAYVITATLIVVIGLILLAVYAYMKKH